VDLADYIRVVRKRWRVIAITVLVAIAITAVQTLLSTKMYTASTQVFVSTSGGSDSAQLLQGSSFTQQRVKSYAELVTTPVVLDPVIADLGLTLSSDELASHITATAPVDTVLIDIAVRDTDPALAARIADDVGKQFAKTVAAPRERLREVLEPGEGVRRAPAAGSHQPGQPAAGAQPGHRAGPRPAGRTGARAVA